MTGQRLTALFPPTAMNDQSGDDIARPNTPLLDTPREEIFDRVTRMVCRLLDVPVSLFSIVDCSRQFFKSAHGLAEPWASLRETPLSHSICQHVVKLGTPLMIGDTAAEISLSGNLAITQLNARAYLGVPVRNADGVVFASLCAIGHEKRNWREDDLTTMRDLAAVVESELQLRSEILSRREAERHLRLNEARLRSIADAAPAMMWQTDQRGASIYRSRRWQEFTGQPPSQALGFGWLDAVHPEDRARIGEIILHAMRRSTRSMPITGCYARMAPGGASRTPGIRILRTTEPFLAWSVPPMTIRSASRLRRLANSSDGSSRTGSRMSSR